MTVRVAAVRTRTLDLDVTATDLDGGLRFTRRITPIMLETATGRSTAIPAAARSLLTNYPIGVNGAAVYVNDTSASAIAYRA